MPSVLISGASRGIGPATALRLARAGWTVYATVRQAAGGEELVAEAAGHQVRPLQAARRASECGRVSSQLLSRWEAG
jgi:NAD(P)-dependent dehydrogenase (short-subunit alcohol dehydrogenase family)